MHAKGLHVCISVPTRVLLASYPGHLGGERRPGYDTRVLWND